MFRLSLVLVIIGALDWLLVGLFQWDLVGTLFGSQGTLVTRIVYTIVGLAGLYLIPALFKKES